VKFFSSQNAIDQSIFHCNDFYGFVCGKFLGDTIIHDRFGQKYYDDEAHETALVTLKTLIEEDSPIEENAAFRKMKLFYKTCLDRNTIDKLKAKPFLESIGNAIRWPLLNIGMDKNESSWDEIDMKLFKAGFTENYLINVVMAGASQNTQRNIIIESTSHLILDKFNALLLEGLANDKIRAYYDYMVSFLVLLGANKTEAENEMLKVLNFEIEMRKVNGSMYR
jgi:predicted metalloendopeptidase